MANALAETGFVLYCGLIVALSAGLIFSGIMAFLEATAPARRRRARKASRRTRTR